MSKYSLENRKKAFYCRTALLPEETAQRALRGELTEDEWLRIRDKVDAQEAEISKAIKLIRNNE